MPARKQKKSAAKSRKESSRVKRKVGRPTDYRPEFAQQARALCEAGATDREVAQAFEVSESTIHSWKHRHPEFLKSLKLGKEAADDRVEQSLYRRALGYTFDATKVFQHNGKPVVVPYIEHAPPDTTAGIFWLKNRRPDHWRDIKAVEHSGAVRVTHASELSDAELERIAAGGGRGAASPEDGSQDPSGVH